MATTAEKLIYLNETKTAIKDAIEAQGVEVADDATFRSYADRIAEISSGGGGLMIVTVENDVSNYSYQEIKDAFYAGTDVVLIYPGSDALILPLVRFEYDEVAAFELITTTTKYLIQIRVDGEVVNGTETENLGIPHTTWIGYANESYSYDASYYIENLAMEDRYVLTAKGEFSVNDKTVLVYLPFVGITRGENEETYAHFSIVSTITGEPVLYNAVIDDNQACVKTATPLGYVNGEEVSY